MTETQRKVRIAIVGNRDNGKSTFVNAWLRNEYTEASEEDCTRGIHNFHISTDEDCLSDTASSRKETLEKIMAVNSTEDEIDSKEEEDFKINLSEPLIKLNHGLSLTLSDYPGLNEYPQYKEVLKEGQKFDVMIALVDASVAARPESLEQQQKLLEFIAECIDVHNSDCLPLVIGINKVDDPTDPDVKKRVEKVLKCIEEVFKVESRVDGLEELLKRSGEDTHKHAHGTFPVVVPLSAKGAYRFRMIAGLTKSEFDRLGEDQIKQLAESGLGLQEVKKLSKEELADEAFKISRDTGDESYLFGDKLQATGFPVMAAAIESCLNGPQRQGYIICQQLRKEQHNIEVDLDGGYTTEFEENLKKQLDISQLIEGELNFKEYKKFSEKHQELVHDAFGKDPSCIVQIVKCFKELEQFQEIASLLYAPKKGEVNKDLGLEIDRWTSVSMTKLLKNQLELLTEKAETWLENSENKSRRTRPENSSNDTMSQTTEWESLVIDDWIENLESMKQKLDSSDIADVVPKEKKTLIHTLNRFHQLNIKSAEGKLAEGADVFSWVDVPERLHSFLKKKTAKKLEEQIAAAAQHNTSHLLKEIQKMHEKQDRGNEELRGELRGIKRSFDKLSASISHAGRLTSPTEDLTSSP